MACGLFGKLPTKRDFIAVDVPRTVMLPWEQWLQGGVTASKIRLGPQWLPAYLKAPIWRFWLGADLCGSAVRGAFMPSVDGVGRYFPLTLLDCADPDAQWPAPSDSTHSEWYEAAETCLLSALEPELAYEALLATLNHLPHTPPLPAEPRNDAPIASGGHICHPKGNDTVLDALTALEQRREREIDRRSSFWWTIGGPDFKPLAIMADRLPDPDIISRMLTGDFKSS